MSIMYTQFAKNIKAKTKAKHEANVAALSSQDQVEQQLWHDVQVKKESYSLV